MIGFILGPDRNSGPVRSGTRSGGIWAGTGSGWVPVDLAGTRPVQQFFYVVFRFYDELPASRAPSCSLAGSRAPLQFPD